MSAADTPLRAEPSHWTQHAQRWQHIGGPLRPGPADLSHVQRALERHHRPSASAEQALLLGVTPELAQLPLPGDMPLLAVDQSQPMIEAVWPGDTARRRALVGDWFELELPDASVSIAMGDGCLCLLDYPVGHEQLAASLARVVRRGGLFTIRGFCRPEPSESVADVFEALFARRIGTFHAFKWRLAMALQGDDAATGVRVDDIWHTFQARTGGARALAERMAWPSEAVHTIDNYRASSSVYSYPTVAETRLQFAPHFELLEEWRGDYELAERCPQLLFRRR